MSLLEGIVIALLVNLAAATIFYSTQPALERLKRWKPRWVYGIGIILLVFAISILFLARLIPSPNFNFGQLPEPPPIKSRASLSGILALPMIVLGIGLLDSFVSHYVGFESEEEQDRRGLLQRLKFARIVDMTVAATVVLFIYKVPSFAGQGAFRGAVGHALSLVTLMVWMMAKQEGFLNSRDAASFKAWKPIVVTTFALLILTIMAWL